MKWLKKKKSWHQSNKNLRMKILTFLTFMLRKWESQAIELLSKIRLKPNRAKTLIVSIFPMDNKLPLRVSMSKLVLKSSLLKIGGEKVTLTIRFLRENFTTWWRIRMQQPSTLWLTSLKFPSRLKIHPLKILWRWRPDAKNYFHWTRKDLIYLIKILYH